MAYNRGARRNRDYSYDSEDERPTDRGGKLQTVISHTGVLLEEAVKPLNTLGVVAVAAGGIYTVYDAYKQRRCKRRQEEELSKRELRDKDLGYDSSASDHQLRRRNSLVDLAERRQNLPPRARDWVDEQFERDRREARRRDQYDDIQPLTWSRRQLDQYDGDARSVQRQVEVSRWSGNQVGERHQGFRQPRKYAEDDRSYASTRLGESCEPQQLTAPERKHYYEEDYQTYSLPKSQTLVREQQNIPRSSARQSINPRDLQYPLRKEANVRYQRRLPESDTESMYSSSERSVKSISVIRRRSFWGRRSEEKTISRWSRRRRSRSRSRSRRPERRYRS